MRELAELTGAGVAKALLGKDVLSDELPWVTGSIGLLGTRPSYELMRDCDTLVIVGSNFPYTQFLPEFGQARAVQIDLDGRFIGMRYPTEVNLVGDAAATLRALSAGAARKADRGWRETVEKNVADWWATIERQSLMPAEPEQPDAHRVGSCRRGCRPTRSSPPTPVRRPTGMPGNLSCAARCAVRCPARWPRWDPVCRTRSVRSSRTRTAR